MKQRSSLNKQFIQSCDYDFLRNDARLGDNIALLAISGSHAYGTNIESSDVDIRGCALNSRSDLLGLSNFEHFVDKSTDTVIYSFKKFVQLLINANPNVIELLGCRPEHYLVVNRAGQKLLDNRKLFLSQRVVDTFGGYAASQLQKLRQGLKGLHCAKDAMRVNKHAMHLIRLYLMCIDILEKEEIITYRSKERELLLSIRNGAFVTGDGRYKPAFFEMVDHYRMRMDYARVTTSLQVSPDIKKIKELVTSVNEMVVLGHKT